MGPFLYLSLKHVIICKCNKFYDSTCPVLLGIYASLIDKNLINLGIIVWIKSFKANNISI